MIDKHPFFQIFIDKKWNKKQLIRLNSFLKNKKKTKIVNNSN